MEALRHGCKVKQTTNNSLFTFPEKSSQRLQAQFCRYIWKAKLQTFLVETESSGKRSQGRKFDCSECAVSQNSQC